MTGVYSECLSECQIVHSVSCIYTIILYVQNILYIYYSYIGKTVYEDLVISVQYIQCTYIISTSLYTVTVYTFD